MSRRAAREAVVKLFYEYEITGIFNFDTIDVMGDIIKPESFEDHNDYLNNVIETYKNNKEAIDELISQNLVDWTIDRLSKIDLSILRVSVIEMLYLNIPKKVSISEAVILAKRYSNQKSYIFINGLLGTVSKDLE